MWQVGHKFFTTPQWGEIIFIKQHEECCDKIYFYLHTTSHVVCKPTGNLPQQVKETKSEVFPVLNSLLVGLEVQVIWIICPKTHQISNVVGSQRVSGCSIIDRPHGIQFESYKMKNRENVRSNPYFSSDEDYLNALSEILSKYTNPIFCAVVNHTNLLPSPAGALAK